MRGLFKTFLLLSITSISFLTYGQASPIDSQLKACLDSTQNQTTAGMIKCSQKARDAWDKELNNSYKQLIVILAPDEKEKLKKAQINWLAFRDSEYIFAGTTYRNLQGTMWLQVAADRQMQIVKQRATDLKNYYNLLKVAK